jgi:hypothetical protein
MTHLENYVIYDHPKDFPNEYVCRRWIILPGEVIPDEKFFMASKDLTTIRDFLQINMGLACIPRHANDDPVILEIWL